jgi:hypothetical protein
MCGGRHEPDEEAVTGRLARDSAMGIPGKLTDPDILPDGQILIRGPADGEADRDYAREVRGLMAYHLERVAPGGVSELMSVPDGYYLIPGPATLAQMPRGAKADAAWRDAETLATLVLAGIDRRRARLRASAQVVIDYISSGLLLSAGELLPIALATCEEIARLPATEVERAVSQSDPGDIDTMRRLVRMADSGPAMRETEDRA